MNVPNAEKPIAIHFGAGNIGRGFIGAVLSQAGFHVVFVDVQKDIIDALNEEHGYDLHILNNESHTERVENVSGVMSTDLETIKKISKEPVSIITTAVGAGVLPKVAKPIAEIIKTRMVDKRGPIDIVACENLQHATDLLKEEIEKELNDDECEYMQENIGFAVCTVDRIVPPFESKNILDAGVEPFYEWTVDRNSLKKTDPDVTIKGMHTTDNLDAYVQRKLFTLNCGHAITSYLGFLSHKPTILEAIQTPSIHSAVSKALRESGTALVKKHAIFNEDDHNRYIETTLHRFANPHIQDEVTRVGKEPLRKLKKGDRLLGPIEMCREFGLPREGLLMGVAAALLFAPKDSEDEQVKELKGMIEEKGLRKVVLELTGWEEGDEDVEKVVGEYEKLKGKGFDCRL
ncbi:mannitol-1-phosphate 5-dehydrogenase [Dendrothele bispora CBS 962.96]|uniref:Mannitol-1-phosphate 5-dehydrogenase n=1 Tax=Dendrothele bispora (strain CBS 962.96) TaxID=1314807 RepID=A0A4S8M6N5_DENBC|nr:mannitol-1-phosphate 5-dehydrogenase [Dendrothele bispora CBS 962.96]